MIDHLVANLVVAFAAFVQASAGIGFALIVVPLLALIDLRYVPGPSLFAMFFLSIAMAFFGRRRIDWQGLPILLPGLIVGTAIGALALVSLPPAASGPIFGGMVLVALLIGQVGFEVRRSPLAFALAGSIAGLMGTMAGMHGPALAVIYQRAAIGVARATIALIFTIASVLSLLSLHRAGLFDGLGVMRGLTLLPGLVAGYGLASWLARSIDDALARRSMLWLAALGAIALIAKSVWSLI